MTPPPFSCKIGGDFYYQYTLPHRYKDYFSDVVLIVCAAMDYTITAGICIEKHWVIFWGENKKSQGYWDL